MDRGAWWATVHRVTKSQTRAKNFLLLTSLDFLFFHLKVKYIILVTSRNINTCLLLRNRHDFAENEATW